MLQRHCRCEGWVLHAFMYVARDCSVRFTVRYTECGKCPHKVGNVLWIELIQRPLPPSVTSGLRWPRSALGGVRPAWQMPTVLAIACGSNLSNAPFCNARAVLDPRTPITKTLSNVLHRCLLFVSICSQNLVLGNQHGISSHLQVSQGALGSLCGVQWIVSVTMCLA